MSPYYALLCKVQLAVHVPITTTSKWRSGGRKPPEGAAKFQHGICMRSGTHALLRSAACQLLNCCCYMTLMGGGGCTASASAGETPAGIAARRYSVKSQALRGCDLDGAGSAAASCSAVQKSGTALHPGVAGWQGGGPRDYDGSREHNSTG